MDLRTMVKEAVSGFLGNSGSLTDTIGEIAKREKLNEHMIRRVCEGANTETRLHFYRQPGINQAAAMFPVADAESIINTMFPEASSTPSTSIDYMLPPPTATIKVTEIKREEETPEPEEKEDKRKDREKEARLYLSYEKFKDLRESFFKEARQYLLNNRAAENINKMASAIDGQETLRAIFPTLQEYLYNYNLHKSAASIQDYLNKDLQVTYVIGDNPLVIKYKTLMDDCNKLKGEIHHQVLK